MMLPKLLVWLSFFTLAFGVYVCPSQPFILTDSLLSHPLESVPSNFNCNFTFIFNDTNSFALANISAWDIGENELVQVIGVFDSFDNEGDSGLSFQGSFPPNQVVINVQTLSNTNLVFSYTFRQSNVEFNYQRKEDQFLTVGTRGSTETGFLRIDFSTVSTEIGATWTISAESTVSIIADCIPYDDYYTFLNVFVYEGSNFTDFKLLGTLYSMYSTLFNSESKTVTLYYSAYGGSKFGGTILLNDKANLVGCSNYRTQWSHGNSAQRFVAPGGEVFEIDVTVDASNGTACLTILNEYTSDTKERGNWPIFQNEIQVVDSDGNLPTGAIVIAGAPMNNISGLVLGTMSYPPSFNLPQFFDGFMRTIIVNNGKIQLETTTIYSKESPLNVTFGMKGFVMTDNYPFLNDRQITSDALVLQHKRMFTFNFQIVHTDVRNGSDEQIVIEAQAPARYGEIYLAGSSGKTYSINTTYVSLDIWVGTNYTANRGTFINYWVTKPGEPIENTTTTTTPFMPTTYTTRKLETQTWSTRTTKLSSNSAGTTFPFIPTETTAQSNFGTVSAGENARSSTLLTNAPTSSTELLKETTPSTIDPIISVKSTAFPMEETSTKSSNGVSTIFPTTLETTTKLSAQTSVYIAVMGAVTIFLFNML